MYRNEGKLGKQTKEVVGKRAFAAIYRESVSAKRSLWNDFERARMSATDLKMKYSCMIQQFKGLPPAWQVNENKLRQIVYRFGTKWPAERPNVFIDY